MCIRDRSQCSFLYANASEFIEIYVGVGAKRIRDLFIQARSHQPCIIFIDEIDCIGQKRSKNRMESDLNSDQERTTTLNQLLAELDGFKGLDNIVLIACLLYTSPSPRDQA
eukprot:TRINITY_DN1257_c0_g1_i3.p2 TRINITY_DN1257_c0_g1~~TRINITY_DN1257_c0_g1_i3.p2  ORF type:complete len:111 (-),score=20.79 TRINITY_DN1257_c0_g1_i3:102-434(-)